MKLVSMNGLTHDMVNMFFEIQKVLANMKPLHQRRFLQEMRDNSIEALAGRKNYFVNLGNESNDDEFKRDHHEIIEEYY